MKQITKENLNDFIHYYHAFHDSYITNINYSINKKEIEISLDITWSGEPTLKEDKTYETNKTKLKMIFKEVEQISIKEIFDWDYINEIFFKYIEKKDKEMLCFATDEEEPQVYIICNKIEYEEIK